MRPLRSNRCPRGTQAALWTRHRRREPLEGSSTKQWPRSTLRSRNHQETGRSMHHLVVMRPQAEGQIATTFVATSCQEQQSVVSRDLQSALLLCCSAALYALWTQSRLHNSRVSLVYRTVEFPSFIGASCST